MWNCHRGLITNEYRKSCHIFQLKIIFLLNACNFLWNSHCGLNLRSKKSQFVVNSNWSWSFFWKRMFLFVVVIFLSITGLIQSLPLDENSIQPENNGKSNNLINSSRFYRVFKGSGSQQVGRDTLLGLVYAKTCVLVLY